MALNQASGEIRLPTRDLERARRWDADRLDLHPVAERDGHLVYRLAYGIFCLFASSGASGGSFTQMALGVSDITAEVQALRLRGVIFEDYPTVAMTDDIADIGGQRGNPLTARHGSKTARATSSPYSSFSRRGSHDATSAD